MIDQSALILAMAPPPQLTSGIPSTSMKIATEIATSTAEANAGAPIVVDPRFIYWEGQSLGAILGTLNAAANPRLSHVALNVGGGTLVDILTNAPNFSSSIGGLLSSVGITPGTAAYLQFLILAKWILDPADPINVARHLLGDAAHPMLPDLLNSSPTNGIVYQQPKAVLGQMAECDQTVPNPFNLLLYGNIGLNIADLATDASQTNNVTLFGDLAAGAGSCPGSANGLTIPPFGQPTLPHAFITTWGISENFTPPATFTFGATDPNIAELTGAAQGEAAAFLANPTNLPPPFVLLPQ